MSLTGSPPLNSPTAPALSGSLVISAFSRTRWHSEAPSDVYTAYYEELCRAAAGGLFDILSHLTAVEAYGPPIDPTLAGSLYPMVAAAIITLAYMAWIFSMVLENGVTIIKFIE